MIDQKKIDELKNEMLDNYCSDILFLLWKSNGMRYTEIYHALTGQGIELSKPTLTEHLGHLKKKKWLTRTVRGAQNVTYSLHESIKKTTSEDSRKLVEDLLERVGVFMNEPLPEVKANRVLNNIIIRKLEELVFRIEIEPKIQNHKLSLEHALLREYENDLVSDCSKDEAYREIVLEKTKEMLAKFADWRKLRASQK